MKRGAVDRGSNSESARDWNSLSRREFMHRNLLAGGVLLGGGALGSLLSACGDSGSSGGGAAISAEEVESARGTIKAYGWGSEHVPKQDAGPVKVRWTEIGGDAAQIPTRIRPEGSFDVFTSNAGQMNQYFATGRLVPIDVSLLENYESIDPGLRDDPSWKGEDGEIYAVPIVLGTALMGWNSRKVPEPKELRDLLRPEYEGMVGLYDDYQMINTVAQGLGLPQPPQLTRSDLEQVKGFLEELRPQVKTFYPFGGEAQLFGRGDIGVAYATFASLILGEQESDPAIKINYVSSVTYADALSVLGGEKEAESLAWIDQALALPAMKELAEYGQAPTTVEAANVDLSPTIAPPFSKLLEASPILGSYPLEASGEQVTIEEATSAWNEYKASFA